MTAVMAHLATARKANMAKGSKGHFTNDGAKKLAKAIVRAYALPTMSSVGITTDKAKDLAEMRRQFVKSHKATLLDFADIIHENKEGEITHSRPENTIRIRLQSVAKAMGLPADTFYAVRSAKFVEGETPKVFIVRK